MAITELWGGAAAAASTAGPDLWAYVMAGALIEMRDGLIFLRDGGYSMPDHIGFELASLQGEVIAEAELVWSSSRVVVLIEHQEDQRAAWEAAGWRVVLADDEAWASRVAEMIKE